MTRKRHIIAGALAIFALGSCNQSSKLPRGNWEESNYTRLNALLTDKTTDDGAKPYAVFDFDNTSIINDVEASLTRYQLENLKFKLAPDSLFCTLTECLDDIDKPIVGDNTARMLISDVSSDYAFLYDNFISKYGFENSPERSGALKEIQKTDQHKDFCAKMSALYDAIGDTYSYSDYCLWVIKQFKGLSYDELSQLTKESCAHYYAMESVEDVTWTSPDMGSCGVVSSTRLEGLKVAQDMKNLYKCLHDNGYEVYICSASMEIIVEAMACDPVYGFNVDEDHVFGLRMKNAESGIVDPDYDESYIQTFKEGKTGAIKAYIAPRHAGMGPALVGGDSNGDYNMLVDFEDLKLGLIINLGNGGNIGKLSKSGDPKYAVQGRDTQKGEFIPASQSI